MLDVFDLYLRRRFLIAHQTTSGGSSMSEEEKMPYLLFEAPEAFTLKMTMHYYDGTIQYSTNNTTWANYPTTYAAAAVNDGTSYKLYIRGTNSYLGYSTSAYTKFAITGSTNVSCIGNIMSLLSYTDVENGNELDIAQSYCFANLFNGCTSLVRPPVLPAKNISNYCYYYMFYNTGITYSPAICASSLPAYSCCYMFGSCNNLVKAGQIKATSTAERCCNMMFESCKSLKESPALRSASAASYCYAGMFQGCTSLQIPPALPATTLYIYCYANMFYNCSRLKKISSIGPNGYRVTGATKACSNMYYGTDAASMICLKDYKTDDMVQYYLPTEGTYYMFASGNPLSDKSDVLYYILPSNLVLPS